MEKFIRLITHYSLRKTLIFSILLCTALFSNFAQAEGSGGPAPAGPRLPPGCVEQCHYTIYDVVYNFPYNIGEYESECGVLPDFSAHYFFGLPDYSEDKIVPNFYFTGEAQYEAGNGNHFTLSCNLRVVFPGSLELGDPGICEYSNSLPFRYPPAPDSGNWPYPAPGDWNAWCESSWGSSSSSPGSSFSSPDADGDGDPDFSDTIFGDNGEGDPDGDGIAGDSREEVEELSGVDNDGDGIDADYDADDDYADVY